jgi:serine/threonine-protein kinase
MATESTDELASALPGYEIGGVLGRGAFGVVLAGRHRQLSRPVAIKQLPRSFSDRPEVRLRFSVEAKILASLDHPHIVPIFDYVEHEGLCVLVTELLPGGSVRQRHVEGLSHQSACAVALATCSALDYAHQRGVLHRDVKPDNLLFTSLGLLKVTDFGIAKVLADVAVTGVGETPGTPMYMAPEQCLDQPLRPATDVYSTGLMLYELLAGEHPFAGNGDPVSVMYRQVHSEAPPLRMVRPAVPASISAVVMRAMAKDPSARFPTARLFGGALADAAAAAWETAWPADEARRIMSVGAQDAAGWSVVTASKPSRSPGAGQVGGAAADVAGDAEPADDWATAPPLYPTVLRPPVPPNAAPPTDPPIPNADPWLPMPAETWDSSRPGGEPVFGAPPTQIYPTGPGSAPPSAYPPDPESPTIQSYPAGPGYSFTPTFPPGAGSAPRRLILPPVPPPSPRHYGSAVAVAALLIAILLVGGLIAITRNRGGKSAAAGKPPSTVTTRPAANAVAPAQVAGQVNQLIQQSAGARNQVVDTVASIENCSANLQSAGSALAAAVKTRQQVVSTLATVHVEVLPSGPAMRDAMSTGLKDSIDADNHFQAWLSTIAGAGGCTGQAPHEVNWQAAQASSNAATSAKETFAALWNPIAAIYNLTKVTSATI